MSLLQPVALTRARLRGPPRPAASSRGWTVHRSASSWETTAPEEGKGRCLRLDLQKGEGVAGRGVG